MLSNLKFRRNFKLFIDSFIWDCFLRGFVGVQVSYFFQNYFLSMHDKLKGAVWQRERLIRITRECSLYFKIALRFRWLFKFRCCAFPATYFGILKPQRQIWDISQEVNSLGVLFKRKILILIWQVVFKLGYLFCHRRLGISFEFERTRRKVASDN